MNTSVRRTQRAYSLVFKWSVVDQVENGELTYKQAQDRYGIQGYSTVLVWLRQHGLLDWSYSTPNCLQQATAMETPKTKQTPEQRI